MGAAFLHSIVINYLLNRPGPGIAYLNRVGVQRNGVSPRFLGGHILRNENRRLDSFQNQAELEEACSR
jgi:hypothetical protein